MREFKIESGGKLMRYTWNPKTQSMDKKDVSKKAYSYLFETCTIEKNVILRDIFILMKKNLHKFDDIFGYYCKEIVTEGLKKSKETDSSIKYLELYWLLFKDSSKSKKISGNGYPQFHGVGQKSGIGLDYAKANDLAPYPLKLKGNISIQNQSQDEKVHILEQYNFEFTLGHILFAIIWELGYHGNPKTRDAQTKKMLQKG